MLLKMVESINRWKSGISSLKSIYMAKKEKDSLLPKCTGQHIWMLKSSPIKKGCESYFILHCKVPICNSKKAKDSWNQPKIPFKSLWSAPTMVLLYMASRPICTQSAAMAPVLALGMGRVFSTILSLKSISACLLGSSWSN